MTPDRSDQDLYSDLSLYTLQSRDPAFPHQYIVDAYAAEHPEECLRPIRLAFALVGLYLHAEKGFTGRDVQRAHMSMGRSSAKDWPSFDWPDSKGDVSIQDVHAAAPGPERDRLIEEWTKSLWAAWSAEGENREKVIRLIAA